MRANDGTVPLARNLDKRWRLSSYLHTTTALIPIKDLRCPLKANLVSPRNGLDAERGGNLLIMQGTDPRSVGTSIITSAEQFHPSIRPSARPSVRPSVCLHDYLSTYLSVCQFIYSSNHPFIHSSIHPSIYPFVRLSACLSACLPVCLSIYLSIYPSVCLSIYLSIQQSIHPSVCPSTFEPPLTISRSFKSVSTCAVYGSVLVFEVYKI